MVTAKRVTQELSEKLNSLYPTVRFRLVTGRHYVNGPLNPVVIALISIIVGIMNYYFQ